MPSSTFSPPYPVRLLFPKGGRSVVRQEGFPKEMRVKILFDKKINRSTFAVGILIGMVQGAESKPNTVHASHFFCGVNFLLSCGLKCKYGHYRHFYGDSQRHLRASYKQINLHPLHPNWAPKSPPLIHIPHKQWKCGNRGGGGRMSIIFRFGENACFFSSWVVSPTPALLFFPGIMRKI